MSNKIAVVILAAGKGTRLKMDIPKPLAPLHNRVLLDYVLEAVDGLGDIHLITGHQNEVVEGHVNTVWPSLGAKYILQKEQLGTGHAVRTYFESNEQADDYDYTLVMCADTPLLTKEILLELKDEMEKGPDAVAATFEEQVPFGYGRIIRAEHGFTIVEEKDASDEERLIKEVNSGLYIFKTQYLKNHIFNIDSNNKAGEFYLTDTFKEDANVKAHLYADKSYFMGVNDLYQLARTERNLIQRNIKNLLISGVRILDPSHTYIHAKEIGIGSVIYPNVHIDVNSKIGSNVTIEPGCFITNSKIEDGAVIKANTYITDSVVGKNVKIGPMAHLRPGSEIGDGSKLGNFVEIKKSVVGENTSISHLSYLGDAEVGNDVNIGCGFITCNYDGANKHKTIIGDGSFIGSDTQMIAPINIGKECYVASGSTINKSMVDGSFAVARGRQTTKEGMAKRFIKKKDKK
ncbi:MAG: UDP-N-acetylglucosamine diphosphorylase/glucosamine-1-phosphate N-acetyltransferase [Bacteriovorax sp. MedPE-SWde]|nr:MAG: UDP-N-acetylglucosamine diphosphorylase/glucosamine-1-phosphate N-acetyltransferase [Bacteriovorax sp. MedPE-SWde]